MITTKDKIGYIGRYENDDGTTRFEFIEVKIKSIRVGKTRTSVYADKFRALDAEEIESNTEIMKDNTSLVLVREPFITNDELTERLKKTVDYWNKYGAETALGNRTKPPEGDENA